MAVYRENVGMCAKDGHLQTLSRWCVRRDAVVVKRAERTDIVEYHNDVL